MAGLALAKQDRPALLRMGVMVLYLLLKRPCCCFRLHKKYTEVLILIISLGIAVLRLPHLGIKGERVLFPALVVF
jgi:hypothetical protein